MIKILVLGATEESGELISKEISAAHEELKSLFEKYGFVGAGEYEIFTSTYLTSLKGRRYDYIYIEKEVERNLAYDEQLKNFIVPSSIMNAEEKIYYV